MDRGVRHTESLPARLKSDGFPHSAAPYTSLMRPPRWIRGHGGARGRKASLGTPMGDRLQRPEGNLTFDHRARISTTSARPPAR